MRSRLRRTSTTIFRNRNNTTCARSGHEPSEKANPHRCPVSWSVFVQVVTTRTPRPLRLSTTSPIERPVRTASLAWCWTAQETYTARPPAAEMAASAWFTRLSIWAKAGYVIPLYDFRDRNNGETEAPEEPQKHRQKPLRCDTESGRNFGRVFWRHMRPQQR